MLSNNFTTSSHNVHPLEINSLDVADSVTELGDNFAPIPKSRSYKESASQKRRWLIAIRNAHNLPGTAFDILESLAMTCMNDDGVGSPSVLGLKKKLGDRYCEKTIRNWLNKLVDKGVITKKRGSYRGVPRDHKPPNIYTLCGFSYEPCDLTVKITEDLDIPSVYITEDIYPETNVCTSSSNSADKAAKAKKEKAIQRNNPRNIDEEKLEAGKKQRDDEIHRACQTYGLNEEQSCCVQWTVDNAKNPITAPYLATMLTRLANNTWNMKGWKRDTTTRQQKEKKRKQTESNIQLRGKAELALMNEGLSRYSFKTDEQFEQALTEKAKQIFDCGNSVKH